MKKVRCAIYTRKSTEEGLEQDFNSLDAQKEACLSYINSQKHEGWVYVDKEYNDGGFSGGNMDRPAFQELLKDIKENKIDIVVVYKVDRLTRSIMDFAKIIEIFDSNNASFVSITQHFNTTTSMGRLTLNILLSFAQFEREVTGERIRDKFEASRKKGLWLTGNAPFGYLIDKHHVLQPIPEQVEILNYIFETYLKLKSVMKLRRFLIEKKILNGFKRNFSKGGLYNMLQSKVYLGKIVYKDKLYEGLHEAIVDEELFNKVQEQLRQSAYESKYKINVKHPSLLSGILYNEKDFKMTTTSSSSKTKKYRYYHIESKELAKKGKINKISAGEIEEFTKAKLKEFIENIINNKTFETIFIKQKIEVQNDILEKIKNVKIDNVLILKSIPKIQLKLDEIIIHYDLAAIFNYLTGLNFEAESTQNYIYEEVYDAKVSTIKQMKNKIILANKRRYNEKLIQAIVKSFWYNDLGAQGKMTAEIRNGSCKKVKNLRFLPKDLIEDILNGVQDPELNINRLIKQAEKTML